MREQMRIINILIANCIAILFGAASYAAEYNYPVTSFSELQSAITQAALRAPDVNNLQIQQDISFTSTPTIATGLNLRGSKDASNIPLYGLNLGGYKLQFTTTGHSSNIADLNIKVGATGGGVTVNAQGMNINNTIFSKTYTGNNSASFLQSTGSAITITNSDFNGNTKQGNGGAINLVSGVMNIIGSKIRNNTVTSAQKGAGIYMADGTLNITGSEISGNTATSNMGGLAIEKGTVTIDSTKFENNTATGGYAAAIYNNGTLTIKNNSSFIGNTAKTQGGAVQNAASLTVMDSLFKNNTATSDMGGAIMSNGTGTLQISGTTFEKNKAGLYGGAICTYDANINIIDSEFTDNSATSFGGAIAIAKAGATATVKNTSFSENKSVAGAGAIYNNTGTLTLDNTAFTENESESVAGAIYNAGTLNVQNGAIFSENKAVGNGGAIRNIGTINFDLSGGNIIFEKNTSAAVGNDISSSGTVNISGDDNTLSISGGISGSGLIEKTGTSTFILDGKNSDFSGTFNHKEGTTNVKGSFFGGTSVSTVSGGTFNWETSQSKSADSIIKVENGAINIGNAQTNAILDFNNALDIIEAAATINLAEGSQILNQGTITFNQGDTWQGHVDNSNQVILDGFTGATSSKYSQTAGSLTLLNNSNFTMSGDSSITGGDIKILSDSILNLAPELSTLQTSSCITGCNNMHIDLGTVNAMNNVVSTYTFNNNMLVGDGGGNFKIDIHAVKAISDKFVFKETIKEMNAGNRVVLNVADYRVVGPAPTAEKIIFQVFEATGENLASPLGNGINADLTSTISGNVVFTHTDKTYSTPIYLYKMASEGAGAYSLNRLGYNPEAYRGAVVPLASYYQQLVINDILFDHIYLDSGESLASAQFANKYASSDPLFAPYQYTAETGSIWFKPYVTFEHLDFTHHLDVENNFYGAIIGFDYPAIYMENGWRMVPTGYLSYNGGHQNFYGVSMYQNGGQGGLMATFLKGGFVGSILAFAGGYANEMSLHGSQDTNGNWFAGTAGKIAYNYTPMEHFTIQPNLLLSYAIFGRQKWNSDFGPLSMTTGYLNGIGVAPGLNLIYARGTWSIYGTVEYLFNINDKIEAHAGDTNLGNIRLDHGYIQYGIGFTKMIQERFMSYFQTVIRNGGRTGVGFQLGFSFFL